MHEALFYEKINNNRVKCLLCPWYCILRPDEKGNCRVRINHQGKLYTTIFNKVAALGIDPIEKKPIYHYYPTKNILSIGGVGCNLHCSFCQNYNISQSFSDNYYNFKKLTPPQIITIAQKSKNNIGIAYTYNEPFTFYEFMYKTAKQAHQSGLKNIIVSNGYINQKPLLDILPFIDAFNIDLKSFDNEFYKKQTKGNLLPVLNTLKTIAKSGKHLEITNLIVPGLNDDLPLFVKMVKWISETLGKDTPLHLSRYFPHYKLNTAPTSVDKLYQLHNIAKQYLNYVYIGNVYDKVHSSTNCPSCGELLIERDGYKTKFKQPNFNGYCQKCGSYAKIIL